MNANHTTYICIQNDNDECKLLFLAGMYTCMRSDGYIGQEPGSEVQKKKRERDCVLQ